MNCFTLAGLNLFKYPEVIFFNGKILNGLIIPRVTPEDPWSWSTSARPTPRCQCYKTLLFVTDAAAK